ncbi:MAG: hypothetical protein K5651_00440 [Bacteroidales bacterium]|nr:hypothetical protein [Bacteroidales bacterium]
MKHHRLYRILATALCLSSFVLAFPSCQREEALSGEDAIQDADVVRFTATAEPSGTRTAISSDTADGSAYVSWTSGDAARLYYSGGRVTANVEGVSTDSYSAGNRAAAFVAPVPSDVTDLYAVYPSSATSSFSSGTLSVTIPSSQDGTFKGANYMVCKSTRESATFAFYHLASYLEINVGSASVARIVIAGENGEALVGTLPVTFDEDGNPQLGTASLTTASITLTVSGAGNYYAALLPGITFTKGLSVRFYDSSDNLLNSYCHQPATSLATVRSNVYYFTDASGLDGRSRYLYATVSGAGDKDGSSWANAMSKTELYAFLNDAQLKKGGVLTALAEEQRNALSGVTLRLGAGTYAMGARATLTGLATEDGMAVNIVGGFPAAGGLTPDPENNETILSGASSYQILYAYPASSDSLALSLTGLTVSGSNAARGGVAALEFHGAKMGVRMNDCVIKDNVNGYAIGGIQLADGVYAEIADCTFSGNQATQGAAAGLDGTGTEVTFTRCVFSGNQASLRGGAVKFSESAADAKLTCIGCDFTGNTAEDWGGAFYCNAPSTATATFTNCTFGAKNGNTVDATKKNHADTYGGGVAYIGDGGAAHSVTFNTCYFYGNTALSGGGAIHVSNELNASDRTCSSNLTFKNCTFEDNSVTNDASTMSNGCGGAVDFRSSGTLLVSGCTFEGNYTTWQSTTDGYRASGGAICISDGRLTQVVDESTVSVPATVKITKTTFKGNHTNTSPYVNAHHMNCGGALAVICGNDGTADRKSFANVYVDKCNFLDNYANQGGVLFLGGGSGTGGTCYMNDCLFDGNYNVFRYATSIQACYGGTLCINNSTFHNTYNTKSGENGKACCWMNCHSTNFMLANTTMIGHTQKSSNDEGTLDNYTNDPSLFRFDSGNFNTNYWYSIINSLIVNDKATNSSSEHYTFISDAGTIQRDDNSGFRPFLYNKVTHSGPNINTSKPSDKGGTAFTNAAYLSQFTGLTWNHPSDRDYQHWYYSWTGLSVANITYPTLTQVGTAINGTCSDFYTWLTSGSIDGVSVDGLSKDQKGTSRPASAASYKPGAIQ